MPQRLSPELLARVAREELDATSLSEREIQRRTGIPRDTLNRRITAGELRSGDLLAICRLLDIPLSKLARLAEKRAA
jgi:transposase